MYKGKGLSSKDWNNGYLENRIYHMQRTDMADVQEDPQLQFGYSAMTYSIIALMPAATMRCLCGKA